LQKQIKLKLLYIHQFLKKEKNSLSFEEKAKQKKNENSLDFENFVLGWWLACLLDYFCSGSEHK